MKPTDAQTELLYRKFIWHMPTERARQAAFWAEKHGTKYTMSKELSRIQDLYKRRCLDKDNCFDSDFWKNSPFVDNKK